MSWRVNATLGAVALVLLFVCALDAKYGRTTDEAEAAASSVFDFEEGAITKFRITTEEETFLLEKGQDGVWYIREPVFYRADQTAADSVTFNLRTLRKIRTVEVAPGAALSPYGLEDPRAGVIFFLGDRQEEVRIGDVDPEQNLYIQAPLRDQAVLTVSQTLGEAVARPMDEFRERSLIPFETYNVDALVLQQGDRWRMQWDKRGDFWHVQDLAGTSDFADAEKIDEILRRVQGTEALEFADGVGQTDLAGFGLGDSATTERRFIALQLKNDTELRTVELGAPVKRGGRGVSPARAIRQEDASTVLFVPETALADFGRDLNGFRSRKALHFSRLDAQEVVYEAGGRRFVLSKDEGLWKVLEPKEVLADEDEVRVILKLLEDLPVSQFVDDAPEDLTLYGLENWARKIRVRTLDGEATLYLGTTTDDGDAVHAMRPEGKAVIAVRPVGLPPTASELYFRVLKKRVLTFGTFEAEGLVVRTGGEERSYAKTDGKWRVADDLQGEELTPVRDAVLALSSLSAVRFVEEGGAPAGYGLAGDDVSLEAAVSMGGEDEGVVHTVRFGKETVDGYYAQLEGSEMIFLADKALFADLRALVVPPEPEAPAPDDAGDGADGAPETPGEE